jgi:tetratricopeptide (TPR) repeat protein
MNRWMGFWALLLLLVAAPAQVRAEGNGQDELDDAIGAKATAENLRDYNKVIELLEKAIDEGLDVENSDFAEELLVETLMQRASQLAAAVQSVPAQQIADPQLQRVWALAVTDLRRVIEYDAAPIQSRVLLAQLLAMPGGDRDEALELLEESFEDEAMGALPTGMRAEALTLRASLQKDPEKALADFEEAIKLEPDEADHRMARADFNRQRGKLDEAIEDINAILENDSEQPGAYLGKAQILREQNKLDEAITALDKASELAPSAPGPYQQRGEIYRTKGDAKKAIEQFNRVLQLQPGNLLTLIHRAEAYLHTEQYDEALVDIEAVLKDNPGLAAAHSLRAQALASLKRLDEAIAALKKIAEAAPDQPEFRLQLASYYLYNKQFDEGIAEYGDLLKLLKGKDDETAKRLRFEALRGRADAYLGMGKHVEAVKDFAKAVKLDGEDTLVLNNYAWVLATSPEDEVRDGKRAVELATKAVELTDEKEAHILSTLAAAYAEAGDFEAARKWSQKSVDMNDPEHAEQLAKELASYQEDKPWRERQSGETNKEPATEEKEAEEIESGDAEKAAPEGEKPATAEAPAAESEL